MDIESEVPVLVQFMSIVLAAFQDRNRFMRFLNTTDQKETETYKSFCFDVVCIRLLKTSVQAAKDCKTEILLTWISVHIHLS